LHRDHRTLLDRSPTRVLKERSHELDRHRTSWQRRWVHHGGWGIEQLADVTRAMTILSEAARLKTPGLADLASKGLGEFVQKELDAHLGARLKGGGVVIINAAAG
jgi:hypothetical protein